MIPSVARGRQSFGGFVREILLMLLLVAVFLVWLNSGGPKGATDPVASQLRFGPTPAPSSR
jgi:hypothetical protein